jgi:hypothetical protein
VTDKHPLGELRPVGLVVVHRLSEFYLPGLGKGGPFAGCSNHLNAGELFQGFVKDGILGGEEGGEEEEEEEG